MKKIYTTLIAVLIITQFSYAQNNNSPWPAKGNVGIGTTSPLSALQIVRGGTNSSNDYASMLINTTGIGVYGPIIYLNATSETNGRQWGLVSSGTLDAAATGAVGNFAIYDASAGLSRLTINDVGYSGLGTVAPKSRLHIAQDISMNTDVDAQQLSITGATDDAKRLVIGYDVNGAGFGYIKAGWYQHQWTNLSLQPNGGNVGIGTITPQEKLSVNGKIRAKEIKVEAENWPDYVFEDNYKPQTLTEIESFIKIHKHLPEVPSAKVVEKDGVSLGEMNKILLKKIEELTLLLIQQSKDKSEQEMQVKDLLKRVQQLEQNKSK